MLGVYLFSCRTQIAELDSGGRVGRHLAELLAERLDDDSSGDHAGWDTSFQSRARLAWGACAAAAVATMAGGLVIARRARR